MDEYAADDGILWPLSSKPLRWPDTNYAGFCTGCGYFAVVNNGAHRADCTAEPLES
jgi:hypothetical protein